MEKASKKFYKTYVIIVILVILAVITNPSEKEHKEQFQNKLMGVAEDLVGDNNYLAEGVAYGLAGTISDNGVTRDDYGLFSITNYQENSVAIGLFGKLFFFKDIDPANWVQ